MKTKWIAEARTIALAVKASPGKLIGAVTDSEEKADTFVTYWNEKHPEVEIVTRAGEAPFIVIQLRKAGQVQ